MLASTRIWLFSRYDVDRTRRFGNIAKAIAKLSSRRLVLDGEVASSTRAVDTTRARPVEFRARIRERGLHRPAANLAADIAEKVALLAQAGDAARGTRARRARWRRS